MSNSTPAASPATSPEPSLLTRAVRGWDRFWFRPADPTTVCFIRLLTAALAFYVCLTYSWDLLSYVGPHGWVDAEMSNFMLNDLESWAPGGDWQSPAENLGKGQYYWSIYQHVTDPGWVVAVHAFILVNLLLFALGLGTRFTGVVAWVGSISYPQRAWATVYGLDTMLLILLAYLLIAPSGAVLSLDRWLAVRRARRLGLPEPAVPPSAAANLAVRLIQVHLCLIYFAGGTSKMLGSSWWNGTALNNVLLNPLFAPMESPIYYHALKLLAGSRWLWETVMSLGNLFTLWVEVGFLFLVWDLRWRWFMICCAVLLHVGIGLFMGLTTFSIVMLIMLASFFPPASVRALLAQVADALALLRRRRVAAPAEPAGKLVMTR